MAEIDQTFYRGTDQYSDGDAEEENLLRIVREGKGFYDLEQMSWPTFYHLNPVRENICNWYPFEPGSRVLEIGAGCGAVTGALCGRGLHVFSVDLSLRRSMINYERHKDCEDLHIVVGNLNEISFPESFDYILLIGVLEYAGRFTEGEHPYQRFLENIRRWLKPDGKLLIAIENRIGLKYFAGAAEDHLGLPFIGLKGYPENQGIRTFSRGELKRLLQKSGYQGCRFYYPYPDYKFPREIFTDRILPSQHYSSPYFVFDQDRTDIFPESEMAETLRIDDVVSAFANSFLVEVSVNQKVISPLQVFYVKLDGGRRQAYRIGTKVYGEGEPQLVSKYPFTKAGDMHICGIMENERRLAEERNVLCGSRDGSEIRYTYMSLKTLEDELQSAELDQDRDAILHVFQQIRDLVEVKPFRRPYDSESFTEWFGTARIAEQDPFCTTIANVDLMPDEILKDRDRLIITNCEWVTDFAVPASFLIWRSIEKTYERHSKLQKIIAKEELWRIFGIVKEDTSVFQEWTHHFENHYISEKSFAGFAKTHELIDFYPSMVKAKNRECLDLKEQVEQLVRHEQELAEEAISQKVYIDQLLQSKRNLEENVRSQEEYAQKLDRDLKEILSSRSWRLTAIFRTFRQKTVGSRKQR